MRWDSAHINHNVIGARMGRTSSSKALRKPNRGDGYVESRLNAMKHGVLSDESVLPFEDGRAYERLRKDSHAEFEPIGPTEELLVEDLLRTVWRKRRIGWAEVAALKGQLEKDERDAANGGHRSFTDLARAVDKWKAEHGVANEDSDRTEPPPPVEILKIEPQSLADRARLSFGQALCSDPSFDRLTRYETHLDRRFGRLLRDLLALQQARVRPAK